MLLDIVGQTLNGDLDVRRTEAPRAGNLLSVQIGALEYAPDAGIDLKYFLESEFRIQNQSFKAYCVQRLLEQRVNVVNVQDEIEILYTNYIFGIGSSETTSEGLIA